jgi:hypothetical protein
VEELLKAYARFVGYEWNARVAPEERVWFGMYDPAEECRMRFRVKAFEEATVRAGHEWAALDLSGEFAQWMSSHEYRESYFESPEDLTDDLMDDFAEHVASVIEALRGSDGVVAIYGLGSLFGLMRVSRLLEMVSGRFGGGFSCSFRGSMTGGIIGCSTRAMDGIIWRSRSTHRKGEDDESQKP